MRHSHLITSRTRLTGYAQKAVAAADQVIPIPAAVSTTDAVALLDEVLVRRRAIHSLALEFQAFAAETGQRFLGSLEPLLRRAIDARAVRPELEVRDVVAVIVMTMATVHPGDPAGAGRRRYFALLTEGLRPSPVALPPLPSHEPACGQ
ncbi:hypothetical protein [Nonomuraea sp. NPDC049158]|uniref:SbtR family transcriptional regulator n=1 Tax=Nonomuraea sp. NPDC049158 TaxID=3155649 RepID=UPI0033D9A1BE